MLTATNSFSTKNQNKSQLHGCLMLKLTYCWDLCSSERTTTSTGMDLGLTRVDLLQVGLTYPKSTRLLPNVSPTERTQQKVLEVLFCICIYYQILLLYWTSALWCSKKYTRRYVLILQWILFCIRDAFIGILILPGIKYLVHSISYRSRKPIKLMKFHYFRHQL